MKSCANHQETLWLDVYGELPPEQRAAWEKHLETCAGCRQERQRLLHLLHLVKEAVPSPELPPEGAMALQESIRETLTKEQDERWWQKGIFGTRLRPIPAFAAALALMIAVGWLGLRELQTPSPVRTASNVSSEDQISAQDMEVIKNLELLRDMDVLKRVVQVVDQENVTF